MVYRLFQICHRDEQDLQDVQDVRTDGPSATGLESGQHFRPPIDVTS